MSRLAHPVCCGYIQSMITSLPDALKLTYDEYRHFPEDGNRHEVLDGDHYMSPAPETGHQTISRRIQFQLYEQIEKIGTGFVFNAPTDIELSPYDIVQPDLLVVRRSRRSIITRSRIMGSPDLIVEILSDSTSDRDRTLKLQRYAAAGVPEYWIVDGKSRTITRFRLLEPGRYDAGEHVKQTLSYASLENEARAEIDLSGVWDL